MVKIIKKIIDIVFTIIIIVLSLYFVLRITGKVYMFQVQTGSMESSIHIGDYIFVVNQSDYYVGDVITYEYENDYITHRIVKKENNKIVTKGDANNTEDDEINLKQVTGKVILSGGILNFIINYKFLLIAIMMLIYLFTCFLDRNNKTEGGKDEKDNNKD